MNQTPNMDGVRGEWLAELEIAERQLLAIAEAIPGGQYAWRPGTDVRSVSEVLMHIAVGNFMLLDHVDRAVPSDVYGNLPSNRLERLSAIVQKNDDMEKMVRDKPTVIGLLKRSLESARNAVIAADDGELSRQLDDSTTVRRIYMRLLVHTHEHMGQMIAYLRMNGVRAPWPDWRPDRQPRS